MGDARKDRLPWLVLPCILLTLSGVTLLVPRQAAQAAPTPHAATKPPPSVLEDDGDGDELLEHWGDSKYAREERFQMAGIAGGFFLLGCLAHRKRGRRRVPVVTLTLEDVTEQRKAA